MARPQFHSRKLRISLSVLAVLALITLSAHAGGPHPKRHDQYKHQVEKLEELWRTAQINGDVEAMDRLLSDDYVGITITGQVVTKTQQLERMRKRSLVLAKMEFEDVKIKLIGPTAVVTALATVEGISDGEPMHGNFRSTRVYSRQSTGTWKITNFEATRVGPPQPPHRDHPPELQSPQ